MRKKRGWDLNSHSKIEGEKELTFLGTPKIVFIFFSPTENNERHHFYNNYAI